MNDDYHNGNPPTEYSKGFALGCLLGLVSMMFVCTLLYAVLKR